MKIDIDGIEFPITIDLENKEIRGEIPSELVLRELRAEIDKYDGHLIKDTNRDRWRVNNIDLDGLTDGGVKVKIWINLRHRERILSVPGRTIYTPWVSISLSGKAEFSASVTNNSISVKYRSHDVDGQDWYGGIVDILADDLFSDQIEDGLDQALSNFNGSSLISLLRKGNITESPQVPIPLDDLLNSLSVSIEILQSGISFVIDIPDTLIIT